MCKYTILKLKPRDSHDSSRASPVSVYFVVCGEYTESCSDRTFLPGIRTRCSCGFCYRSFLLHSISKKYSIHWASWKTWRCRLPARGQGLLYQCRNSKCKRNGPLSREAVSRLVLVLASPESVQKNTRPFHTCTNRPIGHTSSNPGVDAIPLQEQTGVRLSVCRIGKLYLRNPLFIPAHKPFLLPLK